MITIGRVGLAHRVVSSAAAACSTLLGLVVLGGWYLHVPALVQIRPELVPMQYNTALGFVLCGLSLGALELGRRRLARLGGLLVAVLGLTTLSQYVFGLDLGIDQLFFSSYFTVETSHVGRMAPNTALLFSLLSASFLVAAPVGKRIRRSIATGILASMTLAVALVAIFGYVGGVEPAYGWGSLTHMAIHTAVGFTVVGTGLLSYARRAGGWRFAIAWWPAAAGLVLITLSVALWQALLVQEQRQTRARIVAETRQLEKLIEEHMDNSIVLLEQMAVGWRDVTDGPVNALATKTAAMVDDLAELHAIEWWDASGTVRWSTLPDRLTTSADANPLLEAKYAEAFATARDQRSTILTHPNDLAGGIQDLKVHVALYLDKEFVGTLVGTLNSRDLLVAPLIKILPIDQPIRIFNGPAEIYRSEDVSGLTDETKTIRLELTLRNVSWSATMGLSDEQLARLSLLPVIALTTSLVLALLIAVWLTRLQSKIHQQDSMLQMFQAMLDISQEAQVIVDQEGTILLINNKFTNIFGYSASAVVGLPVERLLPESHRDRHVRDRRAYAASSELRESLFSDRGTVILNRDGEEIDIEISLTPIPVDDGFYVAATLRDLIAKRQVEAELLASRETFQGLFENLPVGVYHSSPEGRILSANPALVRILGYDDEEDLKEIDLAQDIYLDPNDREQARRIIESGEGWTTNHPLTLKRKDGRAVQVLMTARPVRDAQGRPLYFEGVLTDTSDLARAEERSDRLGRILEQSQHEIYVFDAESFTFIQVSRGSRQNLGYSMTELREMTPWDLKTELDEESFAELVAPLQRGETEAVAFESRHLRKNGTSYPVDVRLELMSEGGQPIFVAVIQDITERKQLQRSLQLSQRMEAVGLLAGGIAHDFNNLLTAITGYTVRVLDWAKETDGPVSDLEQIKLASDRAAKLTRHLLAYSRQQVLHPRVLGINRVVEGIEGLLRSALGEDALLELDLGPEAGRIRADGAQIERVLTNLAINAHDAMPHGGRFSIRTFAAPADRITTTEEVTMKPGTYAVIECSDTGTGMTEETREHLFEPFFTTKDPEAGIGLGLAMVYGFVKQSDGYIWVDSTFGKGTTFSICLPQVEDEVESSEDNADLEAPRPATEVVLLVEDDPLVRDLIKLTLEGGGYRVVIAKEGNEALEACRSTPDLDMLLTDVVLPGLSGPELAVQVMAVHPKIKMLFISGYASTKLRNVGLLTEVPLLTKPFTPSQLLRKLREVLDSPAEGTDSDPV